MSRLDTSAAQKDGSDPSSARSDASVQDMSGLKDLTCPNWTCQRSSRTYGRPSAAGAPRRRRARPVETSTSTTTVITYGSAWNASGGTPERTSRAWNVNGIDWKPPNKYAPTRHKPGRQNA